MQDRVYQKKSEGRERVERATGWGLGRTATERDWRCHRPVAQTPACMCLGYRTHSTTCDQQVASSTHVHFE